MELQDEYLEPAEGPPDEPLGWAAVLQGEREAAGETEGAY